MKKYLTLIALKLIASCSLIAGESITSLEGGVTHTPNVEIKELYGLALQSLGGNAEVEFNQGYNLGVNYVYYPESLSNAKWIGFGMDSIFYYQTLKDVTINGVSFPIFADNIRFMGFDLMPLIELRYPNPHGLEPYIGAGAGLDTLLVFDKVPGIRSSSIGAYFSFGYEAYAGIRYNFERFAFGLRYRLRGTGGLNTDGQNSEMKTEGFVHHDICMYLSF